MGLKCSTKLPRQRYETHNNILLEKDMHKSLSKK